MDTEDKIRKFIVGTQESPVDHDKCNDLMQDILNDKLAARYQVEYDAIIKAEAEA